MSPTSLESLDRRQQQRVVARSGIRILVSIVLLFALYGTLPVADRTGFGTLLELFIGLIIFGAVLGWQVLKIMGAEHPELRAAEALAIAVPVVLIVFAFTYLSLSHAQPGSFSEPLNHVRADLFRDHGDQHRRVRRHHPEDGRGDDPRLVPDHARPRPAGGDRAGGVLRRSGRRSSAADRTRGRYERVSIASESASQSPD